MMDIFIYSWTVDEEDESTNIRAYALDDSNRNVCLKIGNFTPFVYVDIGEIRDEATITRIICDLKSRFALTLCQRVEKHALYGYSAAANGNRSYIFCQSQVKRKLYYLNAYVRKTYALKCYELSASPVLQLVALRNLNYCGWNSVNLPKSNTAPTTDTSTTCSEEYVVNWRWLNPTSRRDVVTPKMMMFDFEVNSEFENCFPNDKVDDAIFQISCVFNDGRKLLLCLAGGVDDDSAWMPRDFECRFYDDEKRLIVAFMDLIRDESPNLISGYNILGFDLPYLLKRCKRHLVYDKVRRCGFFKDASSPIVAIDNKFNNFEYVAWEGIVLLDLLPYFRNDFKFDNYKLETVASNLLGVGKDPITFKDIFAAYRSKRFAAVGKYCVRDSDLCLRLVEFTNAWISLCEMSRICNVDMIALYTQGQQLKIYSQIYKYALRNDIVVDCENDTNRFDGRYVGAQVFDPVPGFYKNVCPLDFSSLYPSIIIAYNICYSTFVRDDSVVDDDDCNVFEWEDHLYCDHDPEIVERKRLTAHIERLDATIREMTTRRDASKSVDARREIQRAINDTRVKEKPFRAARQNLRNYNTTFLVCEKRRYRFIKSTLKVGVVPTIIQNLLSSRKAIREKIKSESDASIRVILDKEQLAYKICANAMYGAMGVRVGYLPFMIGAMCITYIGRRSIEKTKELISTRFGGTVIYGDTDSNYVTFSSSDDFGALWTRCEDVASKISREFPAPMKLEFEQAIYDKFIILGKKKYIYTKITGRDGRRDDKIGRRGVVLARRDNSSLLRRVYESVTKMMFDDEGNAIVDYVNDEINDVYRNVVSYEDYVITKSIKNIDDDDDETERVGDYKCKKSDVKQERVDSCPAHVQLAFRLVKRGTPIDRGSRIEYVVLRDGGKTKSSTAKLGSRIEEYDYFRRHASILRIDAEYYAKSLINPLDQLLNVYGYKHVVRSIVDAHVDYSKVIAEYKRLIAPKLVIVKKNDF